MHDSLELCHDELRCQVGGGGGGGDVDWLLVVEVGGQVVSLGVGLCKLPGALKYSARKVSDKTLQKPGNHGLTLQAARSITTYHF